MPLDLSGFTQQPEQWAGLYHASDQLEKRKLRQDQLDLQKQSKRAAAGTFLQNYLDPKDLMTGTAYDPMIVQGLQAAQQQGAQLAAAGADAPTLMMALGPMVNKLTQYSTNAKTINKQVDDQIKLMRESGLTGYDYSAIKDLALKKAFYKQGANGQEMVDPGEIDPNANYIQKAIEEHPDKVTTAAGLDLFAKNSPMQKTLDNQVTYSPLGEMNKSLVHLIGQNWLVPEREKNGHISGLVPKHDIALEGTNPLMHNFTDENGKVTKAPVRLLSEDVFDDMMNRRPDIADYLRGVVKQHSAEYTDPGGKPIDLNSPRAKLISRAIAYDELNNRKAPSVEHVTVNDKPSQAQVNLNIQSTDKYLQNVEDKAAAAKRGRASVLTPAEQAKLAKRNVVQVFGDIYNGKEDLSQNEKPTINGNLISTDGKPRAVNNYKVVDITSSMPGGVLKAGAGAGFKYGRVYFHPEDKTVVIEKKTGPSGNQNTQFIEYPEDKFARLMNNVAEPNKVNKTSVPKELENIGYRGGKFGGKNPAPGNDFKKEIEERKKWRAAADSTLKSPFGN